MEVHYTYKAALNLESLPKDVQERIAKKMRFFAAQKDPLKFAERLVEPRGGTFRFRVGDYRIKFDVENDKIFILSIKKRDKAY